MNVNSLIKSNLLLSVFTFLGLILNFISQLVIASWLGTSMERDAYFVAMAVPTYLSAVFLGAYGMVFLPAYIQNQKRGEEANKNFVSNNFNLVFIFLTSIVFVGIIFSDEIISATAIGFNSKQIAFASLLLKILFPTILFQGLSNILTSVFQSQNKFILPAFSQLLSSCISLIFVLVFTRFLGIKSLAIGTLVGNFIGMVLLLPVLLKDYKFLVDVFDKEIHRILILSLPIFLSGFITRSTNLFERIIASTLPSGSISYLGYATQIQSILSTIAISGIGTIIFPVISKKWVENDLESTRKYYAFGIRLVLIITIPIAILFIFQGVPVIKVVFERGKFVHSTTIIVSQVFALLSVAFICNSLGSVVSKIFYLTGKTFLGSITEVFVSFIYFISAFLLVKVYSFYGLAIAYSISSLLSILVLIYLAKRILKYIDFLLIIKGLVIILINSLISISITSYIILPIFHISNIYFYSIVLFFFYGVFLYILLAASKLKELSILYAYFSNLRIRGKNMIF